MRGQGIDDDVIVELWRAARAMFTKRFGAQRAESIVNFWCYAVQRGLLTFDSVVNLFLRYAQDEERQENSHKETPPSK